MISHDVNRNLKTPAAVPPDTRECIVNSSLKKQFPETANKNDGRQKRNRHRLRGISRKRHDQKIKRVTANSQEKRGYPEEMSKVNSALDGIIAIPNVLNSEMVSSFETWGLSMKRCSIQDEPKLRLESMGYRIELADHAILCSGLLSTFSSLWSGEWLSRFTSSVELVALPQPLTSM